jgi:hypothetical protein
LHTNTAYSIQLTTYNSHNKSINKVMCEGYGRASARALPGFG